MGIMRSFIFCLAIVAVSGDAKPWTVAQVANGEHIRNALAEGRGHNVGVITNAAITPTVHAAATYRLPVASYVGYPFAYSYPSVYYGKREAEAEAEPEPYTLAQVAAGQTNGGLLTYVDYGHGTGHRPIVAAPATYTVPAAYSSVYPHVYYGKREAEAEPYTLAQVAAGQTAGGVITSVGGHPVAPFRSLPGYHAYPHVYAAAPHVYYG